jgi:FdhD protein
MARATEPPAQIARSIVRVADDRRERVEDLLAVEEPMEIRLLQERDGQTARTSVAITMRTPGDDFELAVGFLFGEGIIRSREDIHDVSYCVDATVAEEQRFNIVSVTIRPGLRVDLQRLQRNFYTSSSCGVCGKASLDALAIHATDPLPAGPVVTPETIRMLPDTLRAAQAVFAATGGLHAAGLFSSSGVLVDLSEDVGRHNALDKLIGRQVLSGHERLDAHILLLSGRASFELLQKALMARIPLVAAVGAPSSLAVALADTYNITLCGFVRPDGFNIYAGGERVTADAPGS